MAVPEHRKKVIDDLVDKLKAEYDVSNQSSLNNLAGQNGIFVYQRWDVINTLVWLPGDKLLIAVPSTLFQGLNMLYLANAIGYVLLNHSFDTFSFANQGIERQDQRFEESAYFAVKLVGIGRQNGIERFASLAIQSLALWLIHPLATVGFVLNGGNTPQYYINSLYHRAMALKQKTEANIPPK
ncbi:hypothetical protein HYU12_01935 [Candidatus Woesearchaeota archaeon]|nr:hypothetical protein [Candidatus Woesearchaeota archaeon]